MADSYEQPPLPGIEDVFAGGGQMGELMRAFDWSTSPLGPVSEWPQSVRLAVNICLNSRFPIIIWWGPDLIMHYNDAWRPSLGTVKHPKALGHKGQECYYEIWPIIGPMLHGVLATGEATWSDNQVFFMERNGYKEECYFTFSYSPIRDESGKVSGVFTAVAETTEQVLGERRLNTLRDLGANSNQAKTVEEACRIATRILEDNQADIPFAMLYLLSEDDKQATLVSSAGLAPGRPFSPTRLDLEGHLAGSIKWPLARVIASGEAQLVTALEESVGEFEILGEIVTPDSALVMPLRRSGDPRLAGFLVVGLSPFRELNSTYASFVQLVAESIATSIANARAYEAERKRAEALAELDRVKTAFFNNISHEFRTPLTLMLGPLEDALANVTKDSPAQQHERLELVQRNSLRLLKLVNNLLDFSRIEAGRMQAVYKPTDLTALTVELGSVFRAAIERARLNYVVDCPPLRQPVYVDQDMWEKIVLNLLSNAFKFTFEGQITLRLGDFGDHVELEVEDSGTGIPAKELPYLFKRFHRVQGAKARTYEGSGIGLALVEELVKLHGGKIQVRSIYGQGTTFKVILPKGKTHLPADRLGNEPELPSTAISGVAYLAEAFHWLPEELIGNEATQGGSPLLSDNETTREKHHPDSDKSSTQINQESNAGGVYILLADDNADLRHYMQRLLNGQGYRVVVAENGVEALALARQKLPDLLLSDVMMPEMDGFELLRELRSDPNTTRLPVILLSARAGEEAIVEGVEAGADDYLIKPFSARELLARVANHLKLTRMRQEIAEMQQSLGLALEAAQLGSWDLDLITDAARYSARYVQMFGYTEPPMGGSYRLLMQNVLVQDRPVVEECFNKALSDGSGQFRVEYRVKWPDNSIHWLYSIGRVVFNPQNQPVRIAGVVMELTERKQIEEELRTNEERFRRVAQVSSDVIWDWDLNNNTVWWSESVTSLFGYTTEQLGPTIDWWYNNIHPHDQERIRLSIQQLQDSGGDFWSAEYRFRHADGSYVYVADAGCMIRSETAAEASPVRMVGSMVNITSRKQEEARTRFLIDFGEQLRPLRGEESVFEQSAKMLGKYLKVNSCYFAEVNFATKQLTHHQGYYMDSGITAASSAEIYNLLDYQQIDELAWHDPVIINDNSLEEIPYKFYREFYRPKNLRSILMVPLRENKENGLQLIVVAEYHHQPHQWQNEEINLVTMILERVWLAALNARLYKRAQLAAVLEERNRIARDLHDSLQQDFYFIQLQANIMRTILNREFKTRSTARINTHLGEILLQAEGGIAGLRTLIFDLRSEAIARQGLVAGLLNFIEFLKAKYRLQVISFLGPEPDLSLAIKEALYWIAREAFHNIIKHSGASKVELTLFTKTLVTGEIELSIKDNGLGFDLNKVAQEHFGLRSMQERANQHDGKLKISSQVGQGTLVVATFPM